MKFFGFDLTKFFEGLEDVYNLLCAYNEMQKKKIERLEHKAEEKGVEDVISSAE